MPGVDWAWRWNRAPLTANARNNAASSAVCQAGATGFEFSDSYRGAAIVAIVAPFDCTHLARDDGWAVILLG